MSRAKVDIDFETARIMTFKLADGTTTCAYFFRMDAKTLRMVQFLLTESTGTPMLLSIKGLRAMQATIDFATNTMAYRCVNILNETFAVEKKLQTSPKGTSVIGHLPMQDPVDDSDTTTSIPINADRSSVGVPPWTKIRQTWTFATIKHLGSSLRGEKTSVFLHTARQGSICPFCAKVDL